MSSRREKIEAMLARDPRDAFLRYGLAIEMENEGQVDQSLDVLATLTRDAKPYVPAFFRSGQTLAGLDRIEEARTMLRDGIEEARRQNDLHAAGEMSELLQSLGGRGE